jgi:hypothetical protein
MSHKDFDDRKGLEQDSYRKDNFTIAVSIDGKDPRLMKELVERVAERVITQILSQ